MAPALSDQQALAILYDLALTIGSEVNVTPLLTKTLQRFMYHTGFPVGLLLSAVDPAAGGQVSVHLDVAIGDYGFARRQGQRFTLPAALVTGPAALEEAPELLAGIGTRRPQRVFLRLLVPGFGVMLLFGATLPDTHLSLVELFAPILARLGTSITLCQNYEQEVQQRLERVAYYDSLTSLPNSILFTDSLRQAVVRASSSNTWMALVHLDVDDFRRFNAEHGEQTGNRVLVALGQRLAAQLHPGEMVAHLAGDEFGLLLPDLKGWDDVEERIVRILQTNRTPLELDGQSLDVSFSAGIAVLPADSEDGDTLLRHAQMALHQAKQESRGYFRLFDAEQDKRTHARRTLLKRLSQALAEGELRLFYQPKVNMPTGHVIGFEALLRWFDPERGMIPPGEFLPGVESSDFIIDLGEWVMRQALAQAAAWREAGLETCISINIAGRHLQLPDFPDRVRRALAEVPGARPDSLEIEILESSTFEDFEHVREVMRLCSGVGVRFALDDFGTGYSSLAYLHQLPAATIKIDQMFVRRLFLQREDPAIIQAIIQIAQVFGRQVVAEGVEEMEHGMLLSCLGCQLGQGFGIGRPMAAEAVLPWVRSFKAPQEWRRARHLAWHPALYDLLRLRYAHRQWREQVQSLLAGDDFELELPSPDNCGIADWFMISGPQGQASLLREGFRLLGRLAGLAREIETLRRHEDAAAAATAQAELMAASDALLGVIDTLAARLSPLPD